MVLPSGHVRLFRKVFLVQLSPTTGWDAALLIVRSIHKSVDQSAMALFGSCMQLTLAIATPVLCAHGVKKAAPRSSLQGMTFLFSFFEFISLRIPWGEPIFGESIRYQSIKRTALLNCAIAETDEAALARLGSIERDARQTHPDHMRERALVGTPETIRQRLRKYEQAGIQEIILYMPDAATVEPLRLFARECMGA
jgi:hypothetical protein